MRGELLFWFESTETGVLSIEVDVCQKKLETQGFFIVAFEIKASVQQNIIFCTGELHVFFFTVKAPVPVQEGLVST